MADPRTFVSFDYDHNESSKNLFIGQSKLSKSPFSIEDWSSKSSLPQNEWEKIVKDKINKCHILIVLVGKNMSSASGVNKEIKMAIDQGVPFFGVYVDGANSASYLPTGLNMNRVVNWNWEEISRAIDKVIIEGKNLQK